jgi:hypothetical protein
VLNQSHGYKSNHELHQQYVRRAISQARASFISVVVDPIITMHELAVRAVHLLALRHARTRTPRPCRWARLAVPVGRCLICMHAVMIPARAPRQHRRGDEPATAPGLASSPCMHVEAQTSPSPQPPIEGRRRRSRIGF